VLGGAFDLPHAQTHTIVLPHVLAFNAPAMPDVVERIARSTGAADPAAALFDLAASGGAPTGLSALGLRAEDADEVVDAIVAATPASNPRPVDAAAVRQLLADAVAGVRPAIAATGEGAYR
jgi:alcohol dehydrogenase class IV